MSEQNIFEAIENYFKWYRNIYGERVFLEHPLADVLVNPAAGKKGHSAPAKKQESAVHYRQTSPELQELYLQIKDCTACELHKTRKHLVFGYGNAQAKVMFVGEAPGREEDLQGLPFVGPAGKLLDKMFFAIGLTRDEVYIANVLKCRPPNNRNPLPNEVAKCEPYLKKQLEIIKPGLIVALGLYAGQSLLKTESTLSNMRGRIHYYQDIPVIVTYHPAALLRNPMWKAYAWEDLKKIRRQLQTIGQGMGQR